VVLAVGCPMVSKEFPEKYREKSHKRRQMTPRYKLARHFGGFCIFTRNYDAM